MIILLQETSPSLLWLLILEKILSGLISKKLLQMEISDLNVTISERLLADIIKKDKNTIPNLTCAQLKNIDCINLGFPGSGSIQQKQKLINTIFQFHLL